MKKHEIDRIKQVIIDKKTKIISFDVFDTLLVRPFFEPTDLFVFLDREASVLLDTHDVIRFSAIRQEAEAEARKQARNNMIPDVTLEEIYQQIMELHLFSNETISALMEKEKELEFRFCRARKSSVELVKLAKENHKRVIAVSDMYLSSDFIRMLLEANGILGIERVFVSCEARATKASGELYYYIEKSLGIAKKSFVHFGDNLQADVKMARKSGWNAFQLYKPMDMFQNTIHGKRFGNIFKHAFSDARAFFTDIQAMEYLGLRCMLAVAANIVFDDPFRKSAFKGDYSEDSMIFGTIPLGMYIVAQGIWVAKLALEAKPEDVLFYSRDGYLPFLVYHLLKNYMPDLPDGYYVRTSRKALLPLILSDKKRAYTAGSHIRCDSHSPQTITKLMNVVLRDDATTELREKYNDNWYRIFSSEGQATRFIQMLCDKYVDKTKMKDYEDGFYKYFGRYVKNKVLTYDIGYNLRNECIIRYYFPETKICAAITHLDNNTPLLRGEQGSIDIRTFYPVTPYITWLVRERFVSEQGPSCIGYSAEGEPIFENYEEENKTIDEIQTKAVEYAKEYISIFQKDIFWLPIQLCDACLPMESFLHSPLNADRKWFSKIVMEDDVTGIKGMSFTELWRTLRADYTSAKLLLGKERRKIMRLYLLVLYDRKELREKIKKKLGLHTEK